MREKFKMISILYDYQILNRQKYGGISRYFHEIITRLDENFKVKILAFRSQNYYFSDYVKEHTYKSNIEQYLCRIINFFNVYKYVAIHKGDIDIFHPTYYIWYGSLFQKKKIKTVVTVHDMIHEKFWTDSKNLGKRFTLYNKKKLIMNADYIITVSKNTKNDLIKYYPDVDSKKIAVIYHGANDYSNVPFIDMKAKYGKYILFVGQRSGYKNFRALTTAISHVIKDNKSIKLVCVGGGAFSQAEKEMFFSYGISGSVFQINATDEELFNLYRNAVFFVFPSIYEGFGIPILEAFACDCPVLLSNCSCFPEIGGDAVEYFDATDSNSMTEKIRLLLDSKDRRMELISKGRKRLQKFSWDVASYKTQQLYKAALED